MIIVLTLLSLLNSAQAGWSKIQWSTPLREQQNIYVATYFHTGQIDPTIPTSHNVFYMTLVYDFLQTPTKIYSRVTYDSEQATQAHDAAEEWITMRQTRISPSHTRSPRTRFQRWWDSDSDTELHSELDVLSDD